LIKAFADVHQLSEKSARGIIKSNPEKLDDFVIRNARNVIQLARPDYKAVSVEARSLIDKSESEPTKIFLLKREGLSDI
jgi:adenine-specific DNA-methyltransferase